MATFVVAHGAWSAGWAWKKMRPLMRAAGHELWTPTYTGLGERAHLGHADVSLDTHIQDIVAVLETEDLTDVILIGHSYGGMVATGVADRARARVAKLVYLDAFAPTDGQAIFDLVPPDIAGRCRLARRRARAATAFRRTRCPRIPRRRIRPGPGRAASRSRVQAFATKLKLSAEPAMPRYLHLREEGRHRRQLPPVLSARAARGLANLRDRREPQSAHHQSAGLLAILNEIAGHDRCAQIGIAGLGLLGSALAHRLIDAGFDRRATTSMRRRPRRSRRRAGSRQRSTRSRVATWCCSRCSTPARSRTW